MLVAHTRERADAQTKAAQKVRVKAWPTLHLGAMAVLSEAGVSQSPWQPQEILAALCPGPGFGSQTRDTDHETLTVLEA